MIITAATSLERNHAIEMYVEETLSAVTLSYITVAMINTHAQN
jgi:hypothetical protein